MWLFILGAFLAVIVLLWAIEPRLFLLVYESIAFRVDRSEVYISDIARHFPEHRELEANIDVLIAEVRALLAESSTIPKAHHMDAYNQPISKEEGPGWRTFYLQVYSGWFPANCQRCPRTHAMLGEFPRVVAVMYSVMEPGNVIPPHKGQLKGILRYQLPLIVPENGECFIRVDGERHDYQVGEPIMFDDVKEHTVTNATDGFRVILFLDIQKTGHPLLVAVDSFLLRLVTWSPRFRKVAHQPLGAPPR